MSKFAANLTMLFSEQPFLDRFAAARAAGFSGVEYLFPYDFDKAELREQLRTLLYDRPVLADFPFARRAGPSAGRATPGSAGSTVSGEPGSGPEGGPP